MNGKNEAPLYKFLKLEKGGLFGNGIKWNFTKFLVNKEGKVVERYAPVTAPLKIEVICFYLVDLTFFFNMVLMIMAHLFSFVYAERHPESVGIFLSIKV